MFEIFEKSPDTTSFYHALLQPIDSYPVARTSQEYHHLRGPCLEHLQSSPTSQYRPRRHFHHDPVFDVIEEHSAKMWMTHSARELQQSILSRWFPLLAGLKRQKQGEDKGLNEILEYEVG